MMNELTIAEIAEKLWENKDLTNWVFDFYRNCGNEAGDKNWAYRAVVIHFADARMILVNSHTGGAGFVYDIDAGGDFDSLVYRLRDYLIEHDFGPSVWVAE